MAEKGALMEVDLDKVTIPYSEEESRIYFRQMILGIEYCECWGHPIANPQSEANYINTSHSSTS
jgi:hypothetical protein